jgi:hypothetical protein
LPRTEALVRLYDVINANQDWLPRDLGTLTPIIKPKGIDDVPVLASRCGASDAKRLLTSRPWPHSIEAELKRSPEFAKFKPWADRGAPSRSN